jgi:hypothetical protein
VFKIFIISRLYSGSGFGTVSSYLLIGCQGFIEPDLSALLNKNQTPLKEGIFDLLVTKVKRILIYAIGMEGFIFSVCGVTV